MECAKEFRIMELEEMVKALENEKTILKEEQKQLENLENSVRHIFSSGQIQKLKNPNKQINWTIDEISNATSLYAAGPRAYRLLYDKNFPLPGPSTIRRWAMKNRRAVAIEKDVPI